MHLNAMELTVGYSIDRSLRNKINLQELTIYRIKVFICKNNQESCEIEVGFGMTTSLDNSYNKQKWDMYKKDVVTGISNNQVC